MSGQQDKSSVACLLVNHIIQLLPLHIQLCQVSELLNGFCLEGACPVSTVWGQQHVVQIPQWTILWQGLCVGHVQTSSPDALFLQCCMTPTVCGPVQLVLESCSSTLLSNIVWHVKLVHTHAAPKYFD